VIEDGSGAPWADAEARLDEEDHLRASLDALSRLSSRRMGLEDLLTGVATLAVHAIPGADGAGLTLLEQGRSNTIVATAPFVTEIDDIQYGIGQGPCISAAEENRIVVSGSLGGDKRWLLFGSRVARLGVHSVISLPLPTPEGVVGAMNVYAHAKHSFDDRSAQLGGLFAVPAAIAVQNAQVLAQTQRLAEHLRVALEEQQVVERAIGIMLSRSGGTAEEALSRLRRMSQSEHRKLPLVAQSLVDEAVRRASRHRPSEGGRRSTGRP
jgi:GAF domain-containing protein